MREHRRKPESGFRWLLTSRLLLAFWPFSESRIPASLKVFVVAFRHHRRFGRDRRDCRVLHDATFGLVSCRCCRSLGPIVCAESSLPGYVPRSVFAGRALMWFLMLQSGVHATIAGVMLAFAIPFSAKDEDAESTLTQTRTFLTQTRCVHHLADFRTGKYGHLYGRGLDATT